MARKSKIQRIRDRAASLRKRQQQTIARALLGAANYGTGIGTGHMMASDQLAGKEDAFVVKGRRIPKYESIGLAGLGFAVLLGGKLSPELSGGLLGITSGIASGAGAVRAYKKKLANP